ncbi:uncharacterized protein LOC110401749 isoform X2 [Numida meleagris]|uniref:uncharacterized protein LOC110401749 isoform X2 n=1 Tax=Numida meleagris TaxID=8996 RepID=UPI000B3DD1D3|nr:uncharacterized protein LOC110401749 isoform X2 [Numida meleagris]
MRPRGGGCSRGAGGSPELCGSSLLPCPGRAAPALGLRWRRRAECGAPEGDCELCKQEGAPSDFVFRDSSSAKGRRFVCWKHIGFQEVCGSWCLRGSSCCPVKRQGWASTLLVGQISRSFLMTAASMSAGSKRMGQLTLMADYKKEIKFWR